MSVNGVNNNNYYTATGGTNNATNGNSEVFDQILDNAKKSLSEDITKIVIKLEPSSLGDVSIKISVEGGITVARFEADNEVVKQVLNDNLKELQDMLKDKGFTVQKTVVELDSEEAGSDSEIAQQIVDSIENSLSKSTPEMMVKLTPSALGNLSIRVYEEDDIEIVEFLAENNTVKNAIHANFDEIKDALKSKGLDVQRYVVSVKEDEDNLTSDNKQSDNLLDSTNSNNMDKNMFLKLLVTQLSNQDPLNPIEDREFIAQMAQFSSLEQMQQINEKIGLNNIILDQVNESLKEQQETINESLYYINNNITSSFEKLSNNQDESLDNDLEVINQLINIKNAIDGYGLGDN